MGRTRGAKNKVKTKVVKVEIKDEEIFIGEEQTQDTMMSMSTVNDQEEVFFLAQVSDAPVPEEDADPTYEYVCSRCKKSFNTNEEYQVHSPCMVVYQVILPDDMTVQEASEEKTFAKPIPVKNQTKLKNIEHLKSETDERGYLVYCNPNPKNPCYCCGEDESTAHNGQVCLNFHLAIISYNYLYNISL